MRDIWDRLWRTGLILAAGLFLISQHYEAKWDGVTCVALWVGILLALTAGRRAG